MKSLRQKEATQKWLEETRKLLKAQSEAYFALIELLDAHGLLDADIEEIKKESFCSWNV